MDSGASKVNKAFPAARHLANNEPAGDAPRATEGFEISASYQVNAAGLHIGTLKVVRKADRRVLYPFDGCATIGPFTSSGEARRAALALGETIVAADIANPEA
jgi:hypothetical protein